MTTSIGIIASKKNSQEMFSLMPYFTLVQGESNAFMTKEPTYPGGIGWTTNPVPDEINRYQNCDFYMISTGVQFLPRIERLFIYTRKLNNPGFGSASTRNCRVYVKRSLDQPPTYNTNDGSDGDIQMGTKDFIGLSERILNVDMSALLTPSNLRLNIQHSSSNGCASVSIMDIRCTFF